jgi:hypothetical protein
LDELKDALDFPRKRTGCEIIVSRRADGAYGEHEFGLANRVEP